MISKQRVQFRLLETPCCHTMLCWVNPRLPNYCPECGKGIFAQMKIGNYTHQDTEAWLMIKEKDDVQV